MGAPRRATGSDSRRPVGRCSPPSSRPSSSPFHLFHLSTLLDLGRGIRSRPRPRRDPKDGLPSPPPPLPELPPPEPTHRKPEAVRGGDSPTDSGYRSVPRHLHQSPVCSGWAPFGLVNKRLGIQDEGKPGPRHSTPLQFTRNGIKSPPFAPAARLAYIAWSMLSAERDGDPGHHRLHGRAQRRRRPLRRPPYLPPLLVPCLGCMGLGIGGDALSSLGSPGSLEGLNGASGAQSINRSSDESSVKPRKRTGRRYRASSKQPGGHERCLPVKWC